MEKVLVGISGGIDSSVAAYLLKERGWAVEGLFLLLYDEPENLDLARNVAETLKIKLHVIDLREEFRTNVVEPFFEGYRKGVTPNPCVLCNSKIKFPSLIRLAKQRGMNYISTGHYARVERHNNVPVLLRGVDERKEQSYFLYGISRNLLKSILFPLGGLTKAEVREIARSLGIHFEGVKESNEVCFLKRQKYYEKLGKTQEGAIIEISTGKILGHHRGIHLFTIGQRKRLGIAYPYPLYVVKIDASENIVYVGSREKAFGRELIVKALNWLFELNQRSIECQVKIRYAMKPEDALIEVINEDTVRVSFHRPQFAPTPGQSAVFYRDEIVLGGGVIKETGQVQ